jgi:hypothetical protein
MLLACGARWYKASLCGGAILMTSTPAFAINSVAYGPERPGQSDDAALSETIAMEAEAAKARSRASVCLRALMLSTKEGLS